MVKRVIPGWVKEASPNVILDCWEERAAICEYDGGMERGKAETFAAFCLGFGSKKELFEYIAKKEEIGEH